MQHYYVHDLNCQFQPVLCHITCQSHHPPSESIAPLLLLVISSQDVSEPMWPAASAQARNGQHARGPFSWPGQSSWKELNRLCIFQLCISGTRIWICMYIMYILLYHIACIYPSIRQSTYLYRASLGMLSFMIESQPGSRWHRAPGPRQHLVGKFSHVGWRVNKS